MRPVHLCTQVFNRHDCLARLVASAAAQTRRPSAIYVVDHGYDEQKVWDAIAPHLDGIEAKVITLEDPGCAHNGNWFIQNVPDDRVCCGDDVELHPEALERMTRTEGDFIILAEGVPINPAACCIIRNSCVEKVGLFDEQISPQYLYFDDTDFIRRLALAGLKQTHAAGAFATHHSGGSQTLAKLTPAQMEEHHRRFRIASANYSWRWGGPPFQETLTEPRPWPRPEGWGM